ncbi:hypothetical protein [Pseudomonas syringae]|uniref:hypothetical protein n=1 Tax=Pseudomonas syringae TaxID=317 RepID=UPI001372BF62|nr:hypothetical protein [Pseudomonas syringae]NAS98247.1 hypothetical protein [Pseudomonas syringae pv. actinidifoliorum]NAT21587.1 hypothetical protein [Pseudomonas syringae pv. actinidifoliorum]NAT39461.1 hypothetical protein [Pseudomonas syringae pv. actinidifoliorum]NAT61818.1 hypothetical protein [Pseudomonas syringae pv. actinidifoliorum]
MEDKISLTLLLRDRDSRDAKIAELQATIASQKGDKSPPLSDTQSMSEPHDYRHELSLRDEQLRRELDLRQESFRAEQASRDAAWNERFSGFLSTQAEHDKVIDAKLDSITLKVDGVAANVGSFESKIDHALTNVRKSNRATLGGLITVGIAIVLGVWGVNSTIISSASSIFTAGQDSNKSQQASEQILKDTQDLLRQLKQPPAPPAQTPSK